MVAWPASPPSSPAPRTPLAALAALACAALLALAVPVAADHPQSVTNSAGTFTVQFDHGGDNEWWVEVYLRGLNGDMAVTVSGLVEGGGGFSMTAVETEWDRTQQGWQKWAPNAQTPSHVPPGKRVQFEAAVLDEGTGRQEMVRSCWFTHPAGVEQCGASPTSFDATFTGVRGNEWWVQANVATNGPAIARVDVRLDEGAWMPLKKQSWGPTAWAASYHIVDGTRVQLRATATDGRVDPSSCREWIPASGQDARIVPCSNVGFDATFSEVKGNEWWVQVKVVGNLPVTAVEVRTGCEPSKTAWRPLTLQSWGSWAASYHLPQGTKVEFRATSDQGFTDASGAYLWTAATPTSSC